MLLVEGGVFAPSFTREEGQCLSAMILPRGNAGVVDDLSIKYKVYVQSHLVCTSFLRSIAGVHFLAEVC